MNAEEISQTIDPSEAELFKKMEEESARKTLEENRRGEGLTDGFLCDENQIGNHALEPYTAATEAFFYRIWDDYKDMGRAVHSFALLYILSHPNTIVKEMKDREALQEKVYVFMKNFSPYYIKAGSDLVTQILNQADQARVKPESIHKTSGSNEKKT